MKHTNIEIKARSSNHEKIRNILISKNAEYKGTDNQSDIYFKTNSGRLKLRKGNIENALIYYNREDKQEPKKSEVILFKANNNSQLEEILKKSLGVIIKVNKKREIYFIDNVKFHLDIVKDLGSFVEIEAIKKPSISLQKLIEQANYYKKLFEIREKDLISSSYSDLLLKKY